MTAASAARDLFKRICECTREGIRPAIGRAFLKHYGNIHGWLEGGSVYPQPFSCAAFEKIPSHCAFIDIFRRNAYESGMGEGIFPCNERKKIRVNTPPGAQERAYFFPGAKVVLAFHTPWCFVNFLILQVFVSLCPGVLPASSSPTDFSSSF